MATVYSTRLFMSPKPAKVTWHQESAAWYTLVYPIIRNSSVLKTHRHLLSTLCAAEGLAERTRCVTHDQSDPNGDSGSN